MGLYEVFYAGYIFLRLITVAILVYCVLSWFRPTFRAFDILGNFIPVTLTTDGKHLIASDGSSRIYFLSPEFKLERSISVKLNGRPVRYLNELEWVDGKIWANVYTTDMILVIDPSDGEVESVINCAGLLPDKLHGPDTDVLNGIAVSADGRIFLTGKKWPRLYEVKLVPAKK